MSNLIERHWQQPKWYLSAVLRPLSWLLARIAHHRYQRHVTNPPPALAVPIVVVGNIHVGGVGKTPMVVALTEALQHMGLRVGLISRGYGRDNADTMPVLATSFASDVGDEPLLLVKKTQAPMVVAVKRVDAAHMLLQDADVDVIIADDGLQHYGLTRQLELVVFPAADLGKRLQVLPDGPLREPLTRLHHVDAVIVSRMTAVEDDAILRQQLALPAHIPVFQSSVHEDAVYGWNTTEALPTTGLLAVCGIGRPESFMASLNHLGINPLDTLVLPDHAPLDWKQVPKQVCGIITTEKDAVKWAKDAPLPVWVLPINATIIPNLAHWVAQRLQLLPTQTD